MNPHRIIRPALIASVLALAACSNGAATNPSAAPSTAAGATATEAPTVDPPPPGNSAGNPPATDGDICMTVPSLDVISAQLDEPVLRLQRLERGPGTELCEAAGDGVANVSFTRVAQSNEQQMRDLAAQLGYVVSEVGDPALPGAFTYAGAVTVFVGDAEFTVQTITLDTISDPTSAIAVQRSSHLLAAWLQLLGVSPT